MKKVLVLLVVFALFMAIGSAYALDKNKGAKKATISVEEKGQFVSDKGFWGEKFAMYHKGPKKGPGKMRMHKKRHYGRRRHYYGGLRRGMYRKKMIMKNFFLSPRMAKALNLTNEQIDKLGNLRCNFQKRMIDLKADKQKAMVDLKVLMGDSDIDVGAFKTQTYKISDKSAQMKIEGIKAYMEARSVLTPIQKKTLDKIWKYGFMSMRKYRTNYNNSK